ncbi:hypothetical protein C0991_009380 [Blastosporella zonata]|nr:hypothetical protein C0991_009380 [Blastosporella zonata]
MTGLFCLVPDPPTLPTARISTTKGQAPPITGTAPALVRPPPTHGNQLVGTRTLPHLTLAQARLRASQTNGSAGTPTQGRRFTGTQGRARTMSRRGRRRGAPAMWE